MSDKIVFRPVDPRTVRLENDSYLEDRDTNGDIIRLYKQNSNIEISIGNVVKQIRNSYKVNIITRGSAGNTIACYYLKCALQNTSSVFLVPLLGFKKSQLFWGSNFVNAFMSTPDIDHCIALLYRFSGSQDFVKFEAWIKSQPAFHQAIDVDKHHVLYVFNIPSVGKNTYELLRAGRYSEIDDIWKLLILSFHGFDRDGKTGQILYKDERLKKELELKFDIEIEDAELHSIPDMKYECFDPIYYSTNDRTSKTTTSHNTQEGLMGTTSPST